MSRRYADNWSHPGYYLVNPYTWPWSPNGHGHEWPTATYFVQCQSALLFWDTAISKFDHENPWSRSCVWSEVKVTYDLQNSKVKVMVMIKPIGHIWGLEFNLYVSFFISWQLDHFWLRYSKFHIWPWKFKVMVKVMVKSDGHIWGLEFNWYICFPFLGNRTIFGWDIANSIYDLEKSRSRSWPRSNLMVIFVTLSSIDMFAFRFVAIGPFLAEQILYLTLKNSRSSSWPKSYPMVTFEP